MAGLLPAAVGGFVIRDTEDHSEAGLFFCRERVETASHASLVVVEMAGS